MLASDQNSITMFLKGETWRDDAGDLVHWKLLFISPDVFVWIRSDWPTGMATKPRFRCRVTG
ncbi:MAG TPA: hypothetical protein ENK83_08395 [Aliiroseovarius sp.]|nr:hypothetical protein [Aliiroseovarius sp.]